MNYAQLASKSLRIGTAFVLAVAAFAVAGAAIPAQAQTSASPDDESRLTIIHNTWSSGAALPTAVFGSAVGVLGANIYVVGGYDGTKDIANTQIYNPVANTWSAGVSLPTANEAATAAVVKNVLYIIGGQNAGVVTNAVWAYNPKTNTWSSKAAMPTARDFPEAVVENNIIYVIGGYNGSDFLSTVESYNPATNIWTTEASLPANKGQFSAGLLGNKTIGFTIVATDGAVHPGVITGDTDGYNATTNVWTTHAADPTARAGTCSGGSGLRLYVAGGYINNGGAAITMNESFTLTTNKWKTTLAPMPLGTMFGGSAVYKGKLYCFGGWATYEGATVNNVQIYQP